MNEWSNKIPARDKFSSVLTKGPAIKYVLRAITMILCISTFFFQFSKVRKMEKPPTKTSRERDERVAHPP